MRDQMRLRAFRRRRRQSVSFPKSIVGGRRYIDGKVWA
jgi:hypothetical protein